MYDTHALLDQSASDETPFCELARSVQFERFVGFPGYVEHLGHGHLHANRTVNEWAGRFLAAFFPTGLGFQRVCHLGHHRRNRTDETAWRS